ncbi:MAG: hypothetical protein ACKPKO_53145, partial [Candidatus Fonsibacter sp.]
MTGEHYGTQYGLGCRMDTGGWFSIDAFLDKLNQHVHPPNRRGNPPPVTTGDLARTASDGTEDLTKLR